MMNFANQGWICPNCGGCYSPATPQCFNCTGVYASSSGTTPIRRDKNNSFESKYMLYPTTGEDTE